MVKGEQRRTENIGQFPADIGFQRKKGEAPKEKFLQKGIGQGDIQGYEDKILTGDAVLFL